MIALGAALVTGGLGYVAFWLALEHWISALLLDTGIILFGLVGGLVVARRQRRKGPLVFRPAPSSLMPFLGMILGTILAATALPSFVDVLGAIVLAGTCGFLVAGALAINLDENGEFDWRLNRR
ncbi:MAG: hypothetical protein R2731_14450 [Nocardioides sp.]